MCAACMENLVANALRIQNSNPCLYRFCTELSISADIPSSFVREMTKTGAELLEIHTEEARGYFKRLDRNLTEDCTDYFNSFGKFSASQLPPLEDRPSHEMTGIVFPGRTNFRPDFTFNESERSGCEKHYVSSQRFSPGIMTVQCCCDKPVLIGYIVMTKPESRSLALTSVLSSFQVPPRVVYYDNACNLVASTILRLPFLLHTTRFLVDRFHYKSHVCSEFFYPDSYRTHDADRTTTAEAINSRLERVVPFLRFVNGDLLVPHLSIRFALLNIATQYRREYGKDELEDEDLWAYFRTVIDCKCVCCDNDGVSAINVRNEERYGLSVPDYSTDEELHVVDSADAVPSDAPADTISNPSSDYSDDERHAVDSGYPVPGDSPADNISHPLVFDSP